MITIYLKQYNKIIRNADPKLFDELGYDDILWIDLLNPTIKEQKAVEGFMEISLQTKQQVEEIESTSKYSETENAIISNSNFSVPTGDSFVVQPVSFIISNEGVLVSVRTAEFRTFREAEKRLQMSYRSFSTGYHLFISLLEVRIDYDADLVEMIAKQVAALSKDINSEDSIDKKVIHRINALLESTMLLRENIFDRQRVLSGILRSERFPNDIYPRLQLMIKDVNSLINHADFSFQRLDYIQDAALGLINIEQNEIVKIFSVAAVIFMPATLVASIYGMNFHAMPELDWVYTFPDGTTTGPATTAVTLEPTPAGLDYVKELMMQEGKYKNDSTVYTNDSLWVNYFCGLAILPLDFNGTTGATFATTLAESGMMLYGRNRDSVDATLIRDTLQTLFYFYDEYATTYGNVSVNTVERTNTRYIDYDAIVEKPGGGTVEPQQPFELGYVEGMGGALVELTLTDEFLSVLGELQAEQEDEGYRTVAINQALLSIYVDGVTDGGWEQGFSQKVIERFDASISRLGLYTDFKTLTPVSDYAYDYEQQYEVTLPYGGYLNRSLGCYTLNISSHIQRLWRAYQEAPIDPETGERQYTEAQKRMMTLYLAPGATDLFTFNRIALQGGIKAGENAPIHMELTYTLIK